MNESKHAKLEVANVLSGEKETLNMASTSVQGRPSAGINLDNFVFNNCVVSFGLPGSGQ